VRLRELLVGIEGLALLRRLYDGTDESAARRVQEVRRLLDEEAFAQAEPVDEAPPRIGYRAWAHSYDEEANPIVALEEDAVGSLLASAPPGRALDAACGTGRHARRLVELGHEVLGVDATPEMLARAAVKVPAARFVEADLRRLPARDGHFDLVVCGLALSHLDDLGPAIAELARVLRPGGRLVTSVLHPLLALLGWQAPFTGADGARGFVREHPHTHGAYLAAFRACRLEVRAALEPALSAESVRAKRRAYAHIPEATVAAYAGLPGVLVWDAERR
jgi:SAM-dependent methyltransferase